MAITFDPAKNARNIRERNLSFDRVAQFDFETAMLEIDDREDYGELRICAVGFLDGRLHSLVFTERGVDLHVISLRKATRTEMRRYAYVKG